MFGMGEHSHKYFERLRARTEQEKKDKNKNDG